MRYRETGRERDRNTRKKHTHNVFSFCQGFLSLWFYEKLLLHAAFSSAAAGTALSPAFFLNLLFSHRVRFVLMMKESGTSSNSRAVGRRVCRVCEYCWVVVT